MQRTRPATALAACVLTLSGVGAWAQSDPLEDCVSMYDGVGVPAYDDADAKSDGEFTMLCRTGYMLAHNNLRKVPDWVLERLSPERFQGSAKRRNNFRPDGDIAQGSRAELDDYQGSGFDRGHMAPAADMKFSQQAMDESFFLSNMSPQVGVGFNQHIWAALEDQVRVWTERRADLIVITGPIFAGAKTIGVNEVTVPMQFFKIAYEPQRNRAIAFVLPNKKIKGSDLRPFLTSIDAIEELTGLDFLPEVAKSKQNRVERNVATLWQQ